MTRSAIALLSLGVLAGCMDIGQGLPSISDVELDASAEEAALLADPGVEETEDRHGFFAGLFGGSDDTDTTEEPSDPAADASAEDTETAAETPVEDTADEAVETPQRGLFAGLFGSRATTEQDAEPEVTTASLETDQSSEPARERRGLGALFGRGPSAAAEPENLIEPGTFLPYGTVGAVCGLSNRDLGRRVEQAAGFSLYDAGGDPGTLRTHYLTGFADGCARQFTASVAMFSDVETHEFVRYAGVTSGAPYSNSDDAYEALKSRICRVGHGRPCGDRLETLAADTTFVTIYQSFGSQSAWMNVLLHASELSAVDG